MATAPITRSALPLNHVFAPRAPAPRHEHGAQVIDPAPPRLPGRWERAVAYVGKRVRLLASGQGARADAQHRHHLKNASRAMDKLLSTLVQDPSNTKALDQALHAMAEAAHGLGKGMEVSLSRLYTVRATVHLEHLPDEQLSEVADNLAHWATLQTTPKLANALAQLRRLVNKEQARRDMFVVFRGMLDHHAAGPAAAGLRFEGALRAAGRLMDNLADDDGTVLRTRQLCLAKELLTQCVDNGSISLSDTRRLLASLPRELQEEWLQAQHAPTFHDARVMDQYLAAAITECRDRMEGETIAALSGVSRALNTPDDGAQLAAAVTSLATRLSALKAHCDADRSPLPPDINTPLQGMLPLMNRALEEHAASLAGLPLEQIYPLASANDTLGLQGSYTETLAQAVAKQGLKTFPSGQVVFPDAEVHRLIEDNLVSLAAAQHEPHTPLGQPRSTGVVQAMWLDLPRATYAIEHEDGQVDTLISPADGLSIRSPELHGVPAALQRELRIDETRLLALSGLANQQLWVGLEKSMLTPASPIRLPDGTPGSIMGQPSDRFTVRLGPQGQLVVRCEHEVKNITAFIDPQSSDQSPIALDPTQSHAWFSLEFEIGADSQVRVSQPLVCSHALVLAPV